MPFTCSIEKQREYRKVYRDRNKKKIATKELPIQKKVRKKLKKEGICYRCFRNRTENNRSYCAVCLEKQRINNEKYRTRLRKLKLRRKINRNVLKNSQNLLKD